MAEPDFGLRAVDHIVGNVEDGKMDDWVRYYEQVFGFNQFLSLTIKTFRLSIPLFAVK